MIFWPRSRDFVCEFPTQDTSRFYPWGNSGGNTVSELRRRSVIHKGGTMDEWRLAYCANLRDVASGRGPEAGGLDLTAERARKAEPEPL
jgi:hypothetical protein